MTLKPTHVNATKKTTRVLHDRGLRVTGTRLALLRALEAKRPMNVEQIAAAMGPSAPNLTTLYRALNTMVLKGIVRRVDLRHGHAHFERVEDRDHHHLVCQVCGRVEDFGNCTVNALGIRILRKSQHFARITQHDLELFGVCVSCAAKERRRRSP